MPIPPHLFWHGQNHKATSVEKQMQYWDDIRSRRRKKYMIQAKKELRDQIRTKKKLQKERKMSENKRERDKTTRHMKEWKAMELKARKDNLAHLRMLRKDRESQRKAAKARHLAQKNSLKRYELELKDKLIAQEKIENRKDRMKKKEEMKSYKAFLESNAKQSRKKAERMKKDMEEEEKQSILYFKSLEQIEKRRQAQNNLRIERIKEILASNKAVYGLRKKKDEAAEARVEANRIAQQKAWAKEDRRRKKQVWTKEKQIKNAHKLQIRQKSKVKKLERLQEVREYEAQCAQSARREREETLRLRKQRVDTQRWYRKALQDQIDTRDKVRSKEEERNKKTFWKRSAADFRTFNLH
ncbi:hypothetical protein AAMO2058_001399200 [Amorphochlora amoebiformis]